MNNNISLTKTRTKNNMQIILTNNVTKLVSLQNLEANSLLKRKKVIRSKSTIYFFNSFI
jgi:hypothetical protein